MAYQPCICVEGEGEGEGPGEGEGEGPGEGEGEGEGPCPADRPECDPASQEFCFHHGDFTPCDDSDPARAFDVCIGDHCVSPGCGAVFCNTGGPHFPVPPPGRAFVVVDHPAQPTVEDPATGLVWQRGSTRNTRWPDAVALCADLVYAGHEDWRLPDRYELHSVVDYRRRNPAIDTDVFQDAGDYFHTASSTDRISHVWKVNFGEGTVVEGRAPDQNWMRCVRGAPVAGLRPLTDRFELSGEVPQQVLRDARTGLQWQQTVPQQPVVWDDALAHCVHVEYAGHDDWRLPEVHELSSLVDDRVEEPAADAVAWEGVPINKMWSFTSVSGVAANAWTVNFRDGSVAHERRDRTGAWTRCVRGPE